MVFRRAIIVGTNRLRGLGLILQIVFLTFIHAQVWTVENHPNNGKMAIIVDDSVQLSNYIYSEISELSEKRAFVAKGELYAYINSKGEELTPYVFTEAHSFKQGFAVVGDSVHKSLLNYQMQVVLPFAFSEVRTPIRNLVVVQSDQGLWGIYDTLGVEKLPLIYDLPPHIINNEIIVVRKYELYGIVNDCNEVVHNFTYQYITSKGFAYRRGKYLRLFSN